MAHVRNMVSTLLQENVKPDREKQQCREKEITAWKESDIASQREMPKAHGPGMTHPDRRALLIPSKSFLRPRGHLSLVMSRAGRRSKGDPSILS